MPFCQLPNFSIVVVRQRDVQSYDVTSKGWSRYFEYFIYEVRILFYHYRTIVLHADLHLA